MDDTNGSFVGWIDRLFEESAPIRREITRRLPQPRVVQAVGIASSLDSANAEDMEECKIRRETQRVVHKILKLVQSYDIIGKTEFEMILDHVIEQVHHNTGLSVEIIGQKTSTVLQALPQEYGQLPEGARSWEAMITYLYLKYLRELGVLKD